MNCLILLDLIDSDSEEDEFKPEFRDKNIHKAKNATSNGLTKKAATTDEKQLKNEILELEKTFESLELDRKSPTPRTGLFRTTSIAATAFMPTSFAGNGSGGGLLGGRPTNRGQNKTLQSLTSNSIPGGSGAPKPLKFSWEESSTPKAVDKDSEEWTYKQVPFFIRRYFHTITISRCMNLVSKYEYLNFKYLYYLFSYYLPNYCS